MQDDLRAEQIRADAEEAEYYSRLDASGNGECSRCSIVMTKNLLEDVTSDIRYNKPVLEKNVCQDCICIDDTLERCSECGDIFDEGLMDDGYCEVCRKKFHEEHMKLVEEENKMEAEYSAYLRRNEETEEQGK